jgi:hypothetical protein
MSDDETRRGTGDDATHPKRRPPIEDNKVRAMVVGPIVYDTIRYDTAEVAMRDVS